MRVHCRVNSKEWTSVNYSSRYFSLKCLLSTGVNEAVAELVWYPGYETQALLETTDVWLGYKAVDRAQYKFPRMRGHIVRPKIKMTDQW